MRHPHWKTETDIVPRFDLAPLYWSAMWWFEAAITAALAVYWWPSHRPVSLALIAATVVFAAAGAVSYRRVSHSDLMLARRELLAVLRAMPPANGWLHRGEHLMFAVSVTGILGLRAVTVLQGDEDDIAESATAAVTHTAVHQFTAYPFNNRIYSDMHPVTVSTPPGSEPAVTITKPGAGGWRRYRRRAQMERKGFAHLPAPEIYALADLLRESEPLGSR